MTRLSNWPSIICSIVVLIITPSAALSSMAGPDGLMCLGIDPKTQGPAPIDQQVRACAVVLARDHTAEDERRIYFSRGFGYFMAKQYRQSAADFVAHIASLNKLAPTDWTDYDWHDILISYEDLAVGNYLLGNYSAALSYLDQLDVSRKDYNRRYPSQSRGVSPFQYAMRGDIEFHAGNYAAAVDQYQLYTQSGGGGLGPDQITELQKHLKLARQLAASPNRAPSSPTSQFPAPSPETDACKLYPNLCP